MDQNLVRTDLLPETMPIGVLVALAVAAIAAWTVAHWVLNRRFRNVRLLYRALMVVPLGVMAVWLCLQTVSRFLFLATSWSLFFASVVGACAFEGAAALYQHEQTRVPAKAGRWMVALRLAAIGIIFFVLMQPVLIGERKRTVRSRVVVLVDDSASMHFTDRQWTDPERVDVAAAIGAATPPASSLKGLSAEADRLASEFDLVKQLAAAGGADMPKEASGEAVKLFEKASAALAECLPKVSASRGEYRAEMERLRSHIDSALLPACRNLDAAVKSGDANGAAAAAKPALDAFAEAKAALAPAEDVETLAWFDSLKDEERKAIVAATDVQRADIVRMLLNHGGDQSLLKRLAERYEVDVFRFGHGARRDESFVDGEARSAPSDEIVSFSTAADEGAEGQEAGGDKKKHRGLATREELFRSATDMTRALETVMRDVPTEELSSVIMFTDGRHTGDAAVDSVARKLGSLGVSVSSVVVGGTVPPFDIAIASARAPESVFVGDKVRFAIDVSATKAKGRQALVKLMWKTKTIDTKKLEIDSDDWMKEVRFVHEPEKRGVYNYHVEVKLVSGELFADNNEWNFDVAVSDDRTNVLLVDNRPRWEFRYLRNLFYGRDKSVHLQDYLLTPDTIEVGRGSAPEPLPPASASRPFGESESGGFPQGIEEWRKFDVIIIGDLNDAQLTPEVVKNIRYCVEERGALLVVIAGPESMPYRVTNQEFRDLLPIEYTPDGQMHRDPPEEEYTFSLSPAGRGHPIMAQSSSSAENEEIWDELPDFHWRIPIDGVKPGAEVLAFAKSKADAEAGAAAIAQSIAATIEDDPEEALKRLEKMRGEQARNALVVARAQGRGKVVMMNTDRMWRLRYRVGDTRHHRFWGQVVRWGAGEKLRVGNTFVRLGTDQLRYDVGEPVMIYARILDTEYNGMLDLEPRAILMDTSGNQVRAFWLSLRPGSNGFYEGSFPGITQPGTYRLKLDCGKAAQALGRNFPINIETRFVVVTAKQPAEAVNVTASKEAPRRMAKSTGGTVMTPREWTELKDDYGGGNKTMRDHTEFQLWCMPPLFIIAILLLTAEWIIRKRVNLA